MRNSLLALVVVTTLATFVATRARSEAQEPAAPQSEFSFNPIASPAPAPPAAEGAIDVGAAEAALQLKVEELYRQLSEAANEPAANSLHAELQKDLEKFLVRSKFAKIIAQLEKIAEQSEGSAEAEQAMKAVEVLKSRPESQPKAAAPTLNLSDNFPVAGPLERFVDVAQPASSLFDIFGGKRQAPFPRIYFGLGLNSSSGLVGSAVLDEGGINSVPAYQPSSTVPVGE